MDIKFELDKVIIVCPLGQWEKCKVVVDTGVSHMQELSTELKQQDETRSTTESTQPQNVNGDPDPLTI